MENLPDLSLRLRRLRLLHRHRRLPNLSLGPTPQHHARRHVRMFLQRDRLRTRLLSCTKGHEIPCHGKFILFLPPSNLILITYLQALFLFTNALSYALGEVISPAIEDPHLIWVWAGPAIALFVQTVIFWFRYKDLNEDEFMTYDDQYEEVAYDGPKTEGVRVPETVVEEGPRGEKGEVL